MFWEESFLSVTQRLGEADWIKIGLGVLVPRPRSSQLLYSWPANDNLSLRGSGNPEEIEKGGWGDVTQRPKRNFDDSLKEVSKKKIMINNINYSWDRKGEQGDDEKEEK